MILAKLKQKIMYEFTASYMTFSWCGRQELNLHDCSLEPKSSVSANFTTAA